MDDAITDAAVAWFACMHSDRRTRTDEDRFGHWLKQDRLHEEAYARVEKLWRAAGPPIVPRPTVDPRQRTWRRTLTAGRVAAAAAIAAVGIGTAFFFSSRGLISRGSFATPTGMQQELKLSDGSTVTLNTRSEVSVDIDRERRIVRLASGEARFKVAKDAARPFVVEAGAARVRALGTAFDVRVSAARVAVTLVEGRVEVAPTARSMSSQRPVVLAPGEQFAIEVGSGKQRVQPVNLERANAWLHRQLIFDDVPLPEAVAEANRYLQKAVTAADPSLAEIRVSGVVRTGSVESLVGALESSFPVEAVEGSDGTVSMRRAK